jgi:hypothetical protein
MSPNTSRSSTWTERLERPCALQVKLSICALGGCESVQRARELTGDQESVCAFLPRRASKFKHRVPRIGIVGQEERRMRAVFVRANIKLEAREIDAAIKLYQQVLDQRSVSDVAD